MGIEVSTQSSLTPPWWVTGVPTYNLARVCRWVRVWTLSLCKWVGMWTVFSVMFDWGRALLSKTLLSYSLPLSCSFDYKEKAFVGLFYVYNHWHFQVSNFFSPKSEIQKAKGKKILQNSPTCHSVDPKDSSPSAFFLSFWIIFNILLWEKIFIYFLMIYIMTRCKTILYFICYILHVFIFILGFVAVYWEEEGKYI